MSISQDITLNNSALEKTSSHVSLSRKSLVSEEDLSKVYFGQGVRFYGWGKGCI